jgi:hypothetical protein
MERQNRAIKTLAVLTCAVITFSLLIGATPEKVMQAELYQVLDASRTVRAGWTIHPTLKQASSTIQNTEGSVIFMDETNIVFLDENQKTRCVLGFAPPHRNRERNVTLSFLDEKGKVMKSIS